MGDLIRHAAVAAGAATLLALGVLAPAAAQAAAPKTLYVSHGGLDSGTCTSASPCATVSFALTKAASGATINVSGTINDQLNIQSPVTITRWPGGPAGSRAVLDGTPTETVVHVGVGVTGVTLHDLTIENGVLGISNDGTLKLTDSTVSGNSEGGIASDSFTATTVIDSTIVKNSANGNGDAGIFDNGGVVTVIASTVSDNTGVGIFVNGKATLGATILAGNGGGNCVQETAGSLASVGYNLTSDKTGKACGFTAAADRVNKNPLLGHLASNGGPTKTLLPGAGGPPTM